jgi:hypothetical protein
MNEQELEKYYNQDNMNQLDDTFILAVLQQMYPGKIFFIRSGDVRFGTKQEVRELYMETETAEPVAVGRWWITEKTTVPQFMYFLKLLDGTITPNGPKLGIVPNA